MERGACVCVLEACRRQLAGSAIVPLQVVRKETYLDSLAQNLMSSIPPSECFIVCPRGPIFQPRPWAWACVCLRPLEALTVDLRGAWGNWGHG